MQARSIAPTIGGNSSVNKLLSGRFASDENRDLSIGEGANTLHAKRARGGSILKPFSWALRNLHNITTYGLLTVIGAGLTPGGMKTFNNALQTSSAVPTPSGIVEEAVIINDVQSDGFLSNFPESKTLFSAFNILHVDSKNFDLNKDGTVLDSKDELVHANKILVEGLKTVSNSESIKIIKDAIKFLNEYYILSVIVWGENGPTKNSVSQNDEYNCQLMSPLRARLFTHENTQKIKSEVRITSQDLNSNKPNINFEVLVNGKWIPLSYQEVKNTSCPADFNPSASKDKSLFTSLFKAAYSKASNAPVPNVYFQTSSTMLADTDYIPMLTIAMSDNELRNVFSRAPEKIVTVAGQFSLSDIKNGIDLRNINRQNPEISQEKAEKFDSNLTAKAVELQNGGLVGPGKQNDNHCILLVSHTNSDKPTTSAVFVAIEKPLPLSSFPPSGPSISSTNNENEPIQLLDASRVRNGHVYAVESFDEKTETIIISDAHGDRVELIGMDQIREHLSGVIFDEKDINTFGDRTPFVLLGLLLSGLAFEGSKKGLRFVFSGLGNKSKIAA